MDQLAKSILTYEKLKKAHESGGLTLKRVSKIDGVKKSTNFDNDNVYSSASRVAFKSHMCRNI